MRRDLRVLTSPRFLAGLLLLLANDFLFKSAFHNALTGKLSDFAGLFVFTLFWAAIAPRARRAVYALTTIAFIFWKSIYSQPLIDFWNALPLFDLRRTVDPTDLSALAVLPLSYFYLRRDERRRETARGVGLQAASPYATRSIAPRLATCAVIVASVFAFAATSYRTDFQYEGQEFTFADSREGLVRRFERLPHEIHRGNYWVSSAAPDDYTITVKTEGFCFGEIRALVQIKEQDARRSRLILRRLEHECPEKKNDKEKMLGLFMHEVVEKLQNDIDAHPPPEPAHEQDEKSEGHQ